MLDSDSAVWMDKHRQLYPRKRHDESLLPRRLLCIDRGHDDDWNLDERWLSRWGIVVRHRRGNQRKLQHHGTRGNRHSQRWLILDHDELQQSQP